MRLRQTSAPLELPFGELAAKGKQMDAPCCDVFELEDAKIRRYPEGPVIFAQLGVLDNLDRPDPLTSGTGGRP
jgi:hypothetical protein